MNSGKLPPGRHVALVGFMGSGKSTIGPLLASRLRLPYEELDRKIQERYALAIPEIFSLYGEERFRRAETWELSRTLMDPPSVVSLGGGAFHSGNRILLSSRALTVWLEVNLVLAWERCRQDPNRPLARCFSAFQKLFRSRQSEYAEAGLRISVDGKSPEDIASEIWKLAG